MSTSGPASAAELVTPWRWYAGAGVVVVLVCAWNGLAAQYASPFHMIHAYDGTQYHLLVRNRLLGHNEVGEEAHTVRAEGLHPVWRPGLVWIEEALTRVLGSVRASAAFTSALGTSLMELALLWLAYRCFGAAASLVILVLLACPLPAGSCFLHMGIGLGPEPWSALSLLVGLGVLVEALRRSCWGWAVAAGLLAGTAEAFRTGNHLLFAVPCAVYGLIALARRDVRGFWLPAVSGAAFVLMMAAVGRLVPSAVDKTTVNLWQREAEFYGPKAPFTRAGEPPVVIYLGGLEIVEGTAEDYYDYIVPRSNRMAAAGYLREHFPRLWPIYTHGLADIVTHGASGVRRQFGPEVVGLFVFQLLASLLCRVPGDVDSLAFGGGVLAHYLIPMALLRGNEPTQYLYVALPLVLLLAAAGLLRCGRLLQAALERRRPELAAGVARGRPVLLALVLAPAACVSAMYYAGALQLLREDHVQMQAEQADLDSLGLEGSRVVCRNMSWFMDRDVVTVCLPYAEVPQLEQYVRGQRADGILLWERERQPLFCINPYGNVGEETPAEWVRKLDERLRASPAFGPPRVSGAWRWYPVQRSDDA